MENGKCIKLEEFFHTALKIRFIRWIFIFPSLMYVMDIYSCNVIVVRIRVISGSVIGFMM